MTLKWEEPDPTPSGTGTVWAQVAAELKARPGQWALVLEMESGNVKLNNTGRTIRSGATVPFRPAGSFEAIVQRGKLYARFVGEAVQS